MKAWEQLYKSLGSPPSLLTCFISMAPILSLSLLFHIQEQLLLLQDLSLCSHNLCNCCTAGYPLVGAFSWCHPQLWTMTLCNTTHSHKSSRTRCFPLWSHPTPINPNPQCHRQQKVPNPQKRGPRGKDRKCFPLPSLHVRLLQHAVPLGINSRLS